MDFCLLRLLAVVGAGAGDVFAVDVAMEKNPAVAMDFAAAAAGISTFCYRCV